MLNLFQPKIQGFGIDLSDFSIKIISLKKNNGKIFLAGFNRQEIAAGVIEEGEIKKESELIKLIIKAIREIKGEVPSNRYCVVSLPETESFVRMLQLPLMEKDEVGEAIKWEIETNIPLKLEEIYYDWQIIQPTSPTDKNQQRLNVLVGVLPQKIVNLYLNALKMAKLRPLVFEIESLATARALLKNGVCEEPTMIIDLGAQKTSLAIFWNQTVYLTASLPISNTSFIAVLSEKLRVSPAQAKQMKFQKGFDCENPQDKIFNTLQPTLNELAEKIKGYTDFFQSRAVGPNKQNAKINRILLCGGGASFSGLDKFLQTALQITVSIGNPWLNIFPSGRPNLAAFNIAESPSYSTAIGLAIRGAAEKL